MSRPHPWRRADREDAPGRLAAFKAQGITFESKNDGEHLIVTGPRGIVDFWPSTGRWIPRDATTQAFGIPKLVEYLTAHIP